MPPHDKLPGLDRLAEICRRHSLLLQLLSPLAPAPKCGESVLGGPFDSQLATLYGLIGAAEFGPLTIYGPDSGSEGLLPRNEWLREHDTVCFRSSLVFGWETGFALYYGTVPKLSDPHGVQPVIQIDDSEALYAVPVASSVDRFFDIYSRYLELMVADPEYVHHGISLFNFPWSMRERIAQDKPLMELVRAGRFDFLTNDHRDALEWLQELQATR